MRGKLELYFDQPLSKIVGGCNVEDPFGATEREKRTKANVSSSVFGSATASSPKKIQL